MLSTMLRKLINAKSYSQVEITKRVNTFFAFGQLTEAEYAEIMEQIEQKYAA